MGIKELSVNSFLRIFNLKSMYAVQAIAAMMMFLVEKENILLLISVFPMLMVLLMGCREIAHEIQTKMLDTLLAKPVSREAFVIGKFVGVFLVGFAMTLILSIVAGVRLGFLADIGFWQFVYMTVLLNFTVCSVAIFLSVIMPEPTSLIFAIIGISMGHMTHLLPIMMKKIGGLFSLFGMSIYYALPNLHHFSVSVTDAFSIGKIGWSTLYAASYASLLICIAALLFHRRDIN